jgi:hypothetical protein
MGRIESLVIRTTVIILVAEGLHMIGEPLAAQTPAETRFVGSLACRDCHPEEYESFLKFARKASSYAAVEKMRPKLTTAEYRGCLACHTTGYGKPGGFRSDEETPELKNAGCEVCHGPGSRHVVTAEAADIRGKLSREDCEGCHSQERVEAFEFKPLIFGGGH